MSSRGKGIAALAVSTAFYGLWGVWMRLIGLDFGIFFQAWTRNFIIVLLVLPLLLISKKFWQKVKSEDVKWFILRSTAGLASVISIFVAFNKIAIGTAYFLSYAGLTIGGYFIGYFFFQEKLSKTKILSLMTALVGLIFIYSLSLEKEKLIFYFLANLNGISNAVWNIFSKKISRTYSTPQIVFVDSLFTGLLGFTISALLGEKNISLSLITPWISNFVLALTSLLGSFLIVYGFRYVEACHGSLIMLLEVIFGVLFSFIFFKEILTVSTWIGGSLILVSLVYFRVPHLGRGKDGRPRAELGGGRHLELAKLAKTRR